MSVAADAPGFVEVRLGALARNYAKLVRAAPAAQVAAVVKADAYGLGADRIAVRLREAGCRSFFVATLEEGIALRRILHESPQSEVFVFEGVRAGAGESFRRNDLIPVLNTAAQIREWSNIGAPSAVHVDTGMSRLGLSVEEFTELFSDAALSERLGMKLLMTHLACADDPQSPHNELQLQRFEAVRALIGDVRVSIGNSAGALMAKDYHGDLLRAGIALYGGNPFSGRENPMEPVASLYARVLQVREIATETTVGYGATFTASAGSRLATVGVGYADGYPRILGNRAQAYAKGRRYPVVGRISMDLTSVDVSASDAGEIEVGDYVEMIGQHVPADEIAVLCSTISYEILAGLRARVPRVYVD